MTLEEFSTVVVPILQLVITSAALVSLFLLWWQIRQTTLWNKLRTEQTFLADSNMALEEALHKATSEVGVNLKARTEALSSEEVLLLWNDNRSYYPLLCFLNDIETTCTAIRAGIVDPQVAYAAHASRVVGAYTVYKPVVDHVRAHHDDEELFCELEHVAKQWRAQAYEAACRRNVERQKAEKAVEARKGVGQYFTRWPWR